MNKYTVRIIMDAVEICAESEDLITAVNKEKK